MRGPLPGPHVVVLGDVVVDVVVRLLEPASPDSDAAASTRLTGGGAGGNVSAWLAAQGVAVRLVARVGDDAAGRAQTDELRHAGVELAVARDPRAPTGTIVVIAAPDGTRTMHTDRGATLGLRADDLPSPLGGPDDHLHVSGYALLDPGPRDAGLAALQRARDLGMTTSVDASSAAPLRRVGAAAFLGWVGDVDVLRASAAEAAVLAPDAADAEAGSRALAQVASLAVVTDGPRGAWVARGERCEHVPAEPVAVVDTVGAGDALTAGFLAAWVTGATPVEALRAGVALASRSLGLPGARPPV